ncbi:MAG: ABC transporter ATP-binding protein [Coriobacteriales bacterium]|jgi:putative ABC transport system ATP-binding protein|nr:ABC transporter ATP-binding protein [Coriobacteriales bacterium]
MQAVELRRVTKRYGSRIVLNQVSLEVEEGELVALIGPSGCGKSTILNMIGVLETCDLGEIRLFGELLPRIESHKATKIRRNTINYLFQSFALINDMTIAQNLLLAMHFLDSPAKEKQSKIDTILSEVALSPLKHAKVNTLSGGEQQRTALARTMLKPGNLVLADEPTGSLDKAAAEKSFSLIQSLCGHYKKTVIMVTHSLELAKQADRVIDLTKFQQ